MSAHGTNPASAAMCGMKIVAVGTDSKGNINIEELRKAAEANKDNLAALMVLFLLLCKCYHLSGLMVVMWNAYGLSGQLFTVKFRASFLILYYHCITFSLYLVCCLKS